MALAKHAASEISPDANYPEKLLNVIMAEFHKDKAACRRYMIEYGLLERDGESLLGYLTLWAVSMILSVN